MIGHRLGHALGQSLGRLLGAGPLDAVSPVKLLGNGTPFTSSSATSASLGKGSGMLKVGDLQVIVQLCTSAPTTPTGYTQVAAVSNVNYTMALYVWTKTVATSGETTTAVSIGQTTAGLLQGVLLGLRGLKATPVLDVVQTDTAYQSTSNPQPIVGATPTGNGLALALCCPGNGSGGVSFTGSAGWSALLGALFNSRMGIVYRNAKAGQALSGSIASSSFANGFTTNWDKATLTFK